MLVYFPVKKVNKYFDLKINDSLTLYQEPLFSLGKPAKKNWIFYDNLSKGG